MKAVIFFVFSLLAVSSFAATSVKLRCSVPTTIFDAHTEGDKVILHVSHPYGLEYTPLYKGAVSPVGLDQLISQREVAKNMGKDQTFVWPLKSCAVRANRIFDCTNGEHLEINGLKIHPITFRTIINNLSMATGDYEVFTPEVVFVVEDAPSSAGLMFSLSADYSFARHCIQD